MPKIEIKFFPIGSTVDYEIRPGVFVEAEIIGRSETIGHYHCRYGTEEGGGIKDGVIDSHNLYDPDRWPHLALADANPSTAALTRTKRAAPKI